MTALPTIVGAQRGVLPAGTQLSGIYEIEALLATGGMGEVYRAHAIETGDKVAIKMIRWEFASDETFVALFRKEAASLYRIQHEAIIRYYISATDPVLRRPYLAMELIEGESLTQALRRAPLDVSSVLVLMERLASGLAVAHDFGIIHRDMAPDNVYLPDGDPSRAKVIDFGIARSAFGGDSVIGASFAGKLNFVSPEQVGLFEGEVSARSDIYSLGLTLAAAAAGSPIDMGGTHVSMVQKRQVIPDLTGMDARLRPILAPLLQPRPKDRPENMREVVALARAAAMDIGREAPKPIPSPRVSAASRDAAGTMPRRRPLKTIAGAAAAAVLLLGIGVFAVEQWGRNDNAKTAGLSTAPPSQVAATEARIAPPAGEKAGPPSGRTPPPAAQPSGPVASPAARPAPPPSTTAPVSTADANKPEARLRPAPPVPIAATTPESPPPPLPAPQAAQTAAPGIDTAHRDSPTQPPLPPAETKPVPLVEHAAPASAPVSSPSLPVPPPSSVVLVPSAQAPLTHQPVEPPAPEASDLRELPVPPPALVPASPTADASSSRPEEVENPPPRLDAPLPAPPVAASDTAPSLVPAGPAAEPPPPAEQVASPTRVNPPPAPEITPAAAEPLPHNTRDEIATPPASSPTRASPEIAPAGPPPQAAATSSPQPGVSSAPGSPSAAAQRANAPTDTPAPAPVDAAALKPGDTFADCPTCPRMVVIGQGSFRMGSTADATEKPVHKVTVGAFAMGVAPVSVAEWGRCVADKACHVDPGGEAQTFVHNLSFDDASDYVTWLSRITGHAYRLPSEAEWEYAARAGTTTRYWWGEQFRPDLSPCRTCGAPSNLPPDSHRFQPNPFGLLAVTGAVSQWTLDCWHKSYAKAPVDGSAWLSPGCREHVLRGGAWNNAPDALRITNRDFYDGAVRYPGHGIRVARSL